MENKRKLMSNHVSFYYLPWKMPKYSNDLFVVLVHAVLVRFVSPTERLLILLNWKMRTMFLVKKSTLDIHLPVLHLLQNQVLSLKLTKKQLMTMFN